MNWQAQSSGGSVIQFHCKRKYVARGCFFSQFFNSDFYCSCETRSPWSANEKKVLLQGSTHLINPAERGNHLFSVHISCASKERQFLSLVWLIEGQKESPGCLGIGLVVVTQGRQTCAKSEACVEQGRNSTRCPSVCREFIAPSSSLKPWSCRPSTVARFLPGFFYLR